MDVINHFVMYRFWICSSDVWFLVCCAVVFLL